MDCEQKFGVDSLLFFSLVTCSHTYILTTRYQVPGTL